MSYVQQTFKDDTVLFANDLNKMSAGIASKQDKEMLELVSTVDGYYINSAMGNSPNDAFAINKYKIEGQTKIRVIARIGAVAYLAWTDASGKRTQAGVGNSNAGLNYDTTLDVPETAAYLEVGYSKTYTCVVTTNLVWSTSAPAQSGSSTTPASQWKGKKLGLLGDSIAAAGGFFNTLKTELGASGKNVSVGGWFYAEDTGFENEYPDDAQKGIYRQIANLDGDEDLIIIWAGTNDFGHGHKIGELYTIDENKVRQPIYDTTTLYGGFHEAVKRLYDKYTYIPIVVCTPLQRVIGTGENYPKSSRDANQIGKYLNEYQEAIRKAADFYSIPVFEAGAMTNLDPHNQYIYTTYLPDGLHPNTAGHTIIGKAMAKFINNNLYLPN